MAKEEEGASPAYEEEMAFAATHRESWSTPIRGRKLTLRPFGADEDVEAMVKQANNRKVWLNLRDRFPHPYSEENARFWLKLQMGCEAPFHNLAIEVDGRFAGGIGLELHEDVHRHCAELGYWLGEEHWGKGIMTEAVSLFLKYAFSHFRLLRIDAGCYHRNNASARVLEKTGFTFEGRLRRSVVKDGQVLDQLQHSILCSEVFPAGSGKPAAPASTASDAAP